MNLENGSTSIRITSLIKLINADFRFNTSCLERERERERETIDKCISYLFSSFINHGNQRIIMIHTANIHKNIVKQLMYDRENNTNTKPTRW